MKLFIEIIYFEFENFVIPSICFEIATSPKLLAMTHQNKCVGISASYYYKPNADNPVIYRG